MEGYQRGVGGTTRGGARGIREGERGSGNVETKGRTNRGACGMHRKLIRIEPSGGNGKEKEGLRRGNIESNIGRREGNGREGKGTCLLGGGQTVQLCPTVMRVPS